MAFTVSLTWPLPLTWPLSLTWSSSQTWPFALLCFNLVVEFSALFVRSSLHYDLEKAHGVDSRLPTGYGLESIFLLKSIFKPSLVILKRNIVKKIKFKWRWEDVQYGNIYLEILMIQIICSTVSYYIIYCYHKIVGILIRTECKYILLFEMICIGDCCCYRCCYLLLLV